MGMQIRLHIYLRVADVFLQRESWYTLAMHNSYFIGYNTINSTDNEIQVFYLAGHSQAA